MKTFLSWLSAMVGSQPLPPDPSETTSRTTSASDRAHEEEIQKAEALVLEQQQPRNPSTVSEARKSALNALSEKRRRSSSLSGHIQEFNRNVHILNAAKEDRRKRNDEGSWGDFYTQTKLAAEVFERRRKSIDEEEERTSQLGERIAPNSESHEETVRTAVDPEQAQWGNPPGEATRKSARIALLEDKRQSTSQLRRFEQFSLAVQTIQEKEDLQKVNDELVQKSSELSWALNGERENAERFRHNCEILEKEKENLQKVLDESVEEKVRLSLELNRQRENARTKLYYSQIVEQEKADLQNLIHTIVEKDGRLSQELNSQKEQLRQAQKAPLQRLNDEFFQTRERLSQHANSETQNAEASPERRESLEDILKNLTFQDLLIWIRKLKNDFDDLELDKRDLNNKNDRLMREGESLKAEKVENDRLMRERVSLKVEKVENLEREIRNLKGCIGEIQKVAGIGGVDILKVTLYDHLVEANRINYSYTDLEKIMAIQAANIQHTLEQLKVLADTLTSILAEEDPKQKRKNVLYIE